MLKLIHILKTQLGLKAETRILPPAPGDMETTCADVAGLEEAVEYRPRISLEERLEQFVDWFRTYRKC